MTLLTWYTLSAVVAKNVAGPSSLKKVTNVVKVMQTCLNEHYSEHSTDIFCWRRAFYWKIGALSKSIILRVKCIMYKSLTTRNELAIYRDHTATANTSWRRSEWTRAISHFGRHRCQSERSQCGAFINAIFNYQQSVFIWFGTLQLVFRDKLSKSCGRTQKYSNFYF